MKITLSRCRFNASTLLTVMCIGAISLFVLASTMSWTSTTSALTDDAVRHSIVAGAAEAATESALSELAVDFAEQGAATVVAKMDTYRQRTPKGSESPYWDQFLFSDGSGTENRVGIDVVSPWTADVPLISQYEGLKGYAATYRITANASDPAARRPLAAAVQQDIQLALVPVFQFAIFYNLDLEINPGANMTISGRTHSNTNIYSKPSGVTLRFLGDVTSAGSIIRDQKPGDPSSRSGGTVIFNAEKDSGVMTLNLPIGTANTPEAVRQIVEIPPVAEDTTSQLGKQRYFNNSDLALVVSDSGVAVRGGAVGSGVSVSLNWTSVVSFVTLTNTFWDFRENKTVAVTEIDVNRFRSWNNSGTNALKSALGRSIHSIYVADVRSHHSAMIRAVRLVNGSVLPDRGLTVSTPNPLYVKGHFNASGASVGSHNTANTTPASLVADAVTILSQNWDDATSRLKLDLNDSRRDAVDTTVNAALLAGIVETGNGFYSGGVENFPRFLEDWGGDKLTYNGSMVVLFRSNVAVGPWKGTGNTYDIYNPPTRDWAFDNNFTNPAKLPPLCPSVRAVIRGQWRSVAPEAYASL